MLSPLVRGGHSCGWFTIACQSFCSERCLPAKHQSEKLAASTLTSADLDEFTRHGCSRSALCSHNSTEYCDSAEDHAPDLSDRNLRLARSKSSPQQRCSRMRLMHTWLCCHCTGVYRAGK